MRRQAFAAAAAAALVAAAAALFLPSPAKARERRAFRGLTAPHLPDAMGRLGLEAEGFAVEGSRMFLRRVVGGTSCIRFLEDGGSAGFLVGPGSAGDADEDVNAWNGRRRFPGS
jgi:hypothetical protein